jgi:hypothetical protein
MAGAGAYQMIKDLQVRVKKLEGREDILVGALAEIYATSKGESEQPIQDILAGCIKELSLV